MIKEPSLKDTARKLIDILSMFGINYQTENQEKITPKDLKEELSKKYRKIAHSIHEDKFTQFPAPVREALKSYTRTLFENASRWKNEFVKASDNELTEYCKELERYSENSKISPSDLLAFTKLFDSLEDAFRSNPVNNKLIGSSIEPLETENKQLKNANKYLSERIAEYESKTHEAEGEYTKSLEREIEKRKTEINNLKSSIEKIIEDTTKEKNALKSESDNERLKR